jgi:DNA polymerase-3 subunit beta
MSAIQERPKAKVLPSFAITARVLTKIAKTLNIKTGFPRVEVKFMPDGVEFRIVGDVHVKVVYPCAHNSEAVYGFFAKDVLKAVEGLGKDELLTLTFGDRLEIKHATGLRSITNAVSDDVYPEIAPSKNSLKFDITEADRLKIDRHLAPTMSGDYHREKLRGIHFDGHAGKVIATDTHRLAVASLESVPLGNYDFTVSADIVKRLPRGALTLFYGDNRCHATQDMGDYKVTYSSSLTAGAYPNWQRVIPAESTRTVLVDRLGFASKLRRVASFARGNANRVRISFSSSLFPDVMGMTIKARSEDIGEAEEFLPTKCTEGAFKGFEVAVDYRYLLDALNACDSEDVTLSMTESSRPLTVKGGSDDLTVIMPMTPA